MPSTRPTEREVKEWIRTELNRRSYVDQAERTEIRSGDMAWMKTYIITQIAAHIAIQHMPLWVRLVHRLRAMLHWRFPNRISPPS